MAESGKEICWTLEEEQEGRQNRVEASLAANLEIRRKYSGGLVLPDLANTPKYSFGLLYDPADDPLWKERAVYPPPKWPLTQEHKRQIQNLVTPIKSSVQFPPLPGQKSYPRRPHLPNGRPVICECEHPQVLPDCSDIDASIAPLPPFEDFNGKGALLRELANRAIQEYNEKECNVYKFKFLKIVKVNFSVKAYYQYWMTVDTLNITLGTPTETFQIHAGESVLDEADKVIYSCRREVEVTKPRFCDVCFGPLRGEEKTAWSL